MDDNKVTDDTKYYYCLGYPHRHEFHLTPEIQQEMDDGATRILLAMSIAEELGLNDFGKVKDHPEEL